MYYCTIYIKSIDQSCWLNNPIVENVISFNDLQLNNKVDVVYSLVQGKEISTINNAVYPVVTDLAE